MHLLSRIGCTCITLIPYYWKYLWGCIHHILSYYTCHHICICDILCHIHAYRIDRGDNVAGIQRRRGRGSAGDSSSHSSRRRGVDSRRSPWVLGSPANLFTQKQAPEHSKSPMFYKIFLESFMFDALGYKSSLETLDERSYLVQIHIPLILSRSRIEYMLSHA